MKKENLVANHISVAFALHGKYDENKFKLVLNLRKILKENIDEEFFSSYIYVERMFTYIPEICEIPMEEFKGIKKLNREHDIVINII